MDGAGSLEPGGESQISRETASLMSYGAINIVLGRRLFEADVMVMVPGPPTPESARPHGGGSGVLDILTYSCEDLDLEMM